MGKQTYFGKERGIKEQFSRFFLLIAFVVIVICFQLIQPKFLTVTNIMDLLSFSSVIGILALGNMLLMASGEISFSIGAQATVIAALFGRMLAGTGITSIWLAFFLSILVGVALGLIISFFTVRVRIPTFVFTLAIAFILDAFTQLLTHGTTLYSKLWPKAFVIMQHKIGGLIPMPVIVFLIMALLTHIVYEKTTFGRHLYAIGSNQTAANAVGISVKAVKTSVWAINGAFCGLAGIVSASFNGGVPLLLGSDLLVPAIAATMLSATFLQLGKYNVLGIVLSAVLMVVIQNGVISAGYPVFVKDIVQGILLVVAVSTISIIKPGGLPTIVLSL
jgi:ribose/xylose/arabinose/galactoside ABC-type transport system permease subunit